VISVKLGGGGGGVERRRHHEFDDGWLSACSNTRNNVLSSFSNPIRKHNTSNAKAKHARNCDAHLRKILISISSASAYIAKRPPHLKKTQTGIRIVRKSI